MSRQQKQKQVKQKKKKKFSFSTAILLLIMLVGVSVLLYPTVSDYYNSFHQSRAIASYNEAVAALDETDYDALFAQAADYNAQLRKLAYPFLDYEELEEAYYAALDVAGNGIIGYITIPRISVELPIYHGTSDAVLNVAAGHLEGSSLPIGGESTHAVISAHRGLPSAKLFTNLDELQVGDTFTITVLNQVTTYQVDQILIVEPTQMDALNVSAGEDYVTLMTCTPYGINTHRLLVRGTRIENAADELVITGEAVKIPSYIVMPAVMIPILFLLLLVLLFRYRKKPRAQLNDYVIRADDAAQPPNPEPEIENQEKEERP
jgi:sortase A